MTTLQFNCPQCGQVCAFGSHHAGRRARCTKCSTRFLIPAAGQPARIIKPTFLEDGPWSGFWQALFLGTPKAFLHTHGFIAAVLMVWASVLRFYYGHPLFVIFIPFFIGHLIIPVGIIVLMIATGFQCRYFFDIIQSTADQDDPLPWVLEGTYADRFFHSIISTYTLLLLAAASLAPAGLLWFIVKKTGIEAEWPVVLVAAVGLFFLPLSMTIYAYSRDILLSFRLDFVLRAAHKAFGPHLTLYVQFLAIAMLFWQSSFYARNAPPEIIHQSVIFHGLAAGLSILAARTAGLFYRHYGCYLP